MENAYVQTISIALTISVAHAPITPNGMDTIANAKIRKTGVLVVLILNTSMEVVSARKGT